MFLIASKEIHVVGPEGRVTYPAGVTKDAPAWLEGLGWYLDANGARLSKSPPDGWEDPDLVKEREEAALREEAEKSEIAAKAAAEEIDNLKALNREVTEKAIALDADLSAAKASLAIAVNERAAIAANLDEAQKQLSAARDELAVTKEALAKATAPSEPPKEKAK